LFHRPLAISTISICTGCSGEDLGLGRLPGCFLSLPSPILSPFSGLERRTAVDGSPDLKEGAQPLLALLLADRRQFPLFDRGPTIRWRGHEQVEPHNVLLCLLEEEAPPRSRPSVPTPGPTRDPVHLAPRCVEAQGHAVVGEGVVSVVDQASVVAQLEVPELPSVRSPSAVRSSPRTPRGFREGARQGAHHERGGLLLLEEEVSAHRHAGSG
ncbi:hypothetical protein ACHAWF_003673, partial [Thalassiosira exigua]